MGRSTKFFRQSKKSLSGNMGAQNYSQVNRAGWHNKIINFIKVRGRSSFAKAPEDNGETKKWLE